MSTNEEGIAVYEPSMDGPVFESFPKIKRFDTGVCITEKIDGTNGQVYITDDLRIYAGSRNRWLKPNGTKAEDNYGFATWVDQNKEELLKLGPGRHFGEWWGAGIGRGYGMDHRRFSLFNFDRWGSHNPNTPSCCHVVPILYKGEFSTDAWNSSIDRLREQGSVASPVKFWNPEGVVVRFYATRELMKWTFGGNKSKNEQMLSGNKQ